MSLTPQDSLPSGTSYPLPETLHLTLVGCGNMGGALLRRFLEIATPGMRFIIINPAPIPDEFKAHPLVTHYRGANEAAKEINKTDIVLLAIKPQVINDVCAALAPHLSPEALVISVAAGSTLLSLQKVLHPHQPIIRTMPNTPAMIAQGAIVACAASSVSSSQKDLTDTLLSCAGLVRWIEDEMLMNAVTALSGSGPAYVFLLIEILQKSGESLELPSDLARDLARQTVIGTAALAAAQPEMAAATLRQNVTSPGGTTEAALKVLMNGALQDLFDKALQAAQKRGEELSA